MLAMEKEEEATRDVTNHKSTLTNKVLFEITMGTGFGERILTKVKYAEDNALQKTN
jgi:hypothetical protein